MRSLKVGNDIIRRHVRVHKVVVRLRCISIQMNGEILKLAEKRSVRQVLCLVSCGEEEEGGGRTEVTKECIKQVL